MSARLGAQLRWRLPRVNTPLLVLGIGCLVVAVGGAGLSLGGVSAKGVTSPPGQFLLGAAGVGLMLASLVLGVEPPPAASPEALSDAAGPWRIRLSGRRTPEGFLGAPPHTTSRFVPRDHLEVLVRAISGDGVRPVALCGMGGAGKTVLASVAVTDPRVRRRFPDGIAWVRANPHADPRELQSELAGRLGMGAAVFDDVDEGRDVLADLLARRRVLVVLDDVWERAVADAMPPSCHLVLTTRYSRLAHDVDATALEVADLTLEQALILLGKWTGRDRAQLDRLPADELCLRLENLALGVAMAGAMIGEDASPRRWSDVLARLEAADLARITADFGSEYPHPTLLAAIELGIDELPEARIRARYRELAVFAGRSPFTRTAATALWSHAELTQPDVGDVLTLLEGRSLVQLEGPDHWSLHDLQADVIVRQLGDDGLTRAHAALLDGYRRLLPGSWATAPDDGYLVDHLALHLARAGRAEELRNLLTDFSWIERKVRDGRIASLLADFLHLPAEAASRAVHVAVQLAAPVVAGDPEQLRGQLVGRLAGEESPTLRTLVADAEATAVDPWLRPLGPALPASGGPLRLMLVGHAGGVRAVAVAADGSRALSAGDDGTTRVWDPGTGRELREIAPHASRRRVVRTMEWSGPRGLRAGGVVERTEELVVPAEILSLAVSDDGRVAGSGADDGAVCLWIVASGRRLQTLHGHAGAVTALALMSGTDRAVSGGADGTLRVWDLASGDGRVLAGGLGVVRGLAVTSDGAHVFAAADTAGVQAWDVVTGLPHTGSWEGARAVALALSDNVREVVTLGVDGTLRGWNVDSGAPSFEGVALESDAGHADAPVTSGTLAVTRDGARTLVSTGKAILVFDTLRGDVTGVLEGHTKPVRAIAVTADGLTAASASDDGTVRLWSLAERAPGQQRRRHEGRVRALAVTAGGSLVVSAGDDDTLRTWPARGAGALDALAPETRSGGIGALTSIGNELVRGHDDGSLTVETADGGVRMLGRHPPPVTALAGSVEPRLLASAGQEGAVRLWPLAGNGIERSLLEEGTAVWCVAISADARVVAAGLDDGRLLVWNLAKEAAEPAWPPAPARALRGHEGAVWSLAVSLDGRWLVSGGDDATACVWDLAAGGEEPVCALRGHRDAIWTVAIAPTGLVVLTGGGDGTVRAWASAGGGRELARWTADSSVTCSALLLDDPLAVVVGEFGGAVYTLELCGVSAAGLTRSFRDARSPGRA